MSEVLRGTSSAAFREVTCKDCLREMETGHRPIPAGEADGEQPMQFEYSEAWATRMLDRGGNRTDRCLRHRKLHRQTIQGLAVPFVDLRTIGEVADRENPTGPLGGLGKLPAIHVPKEVEVDLGPRKFGMTDADITKMLELLSKKRVLILKAGTGTGKSTFGPFRLMNPPADAPLRLTDFGPIVVTEPRVQATIGVATFVGEQLVAGCPWKVCDRHGRFIPKPEDRAHPGPIGADCVISPATEAPWQVCSQHGRFIPFEAEVAHPGPIEDGCTIVPCTDHLGPGYPVGYQVKGDKKHDESCQLVFITDGTMISWLGQGRLNKIGTVIIDEAHERNNNIDFILGYLKRELDRYPHLRVIVTSATFDVDFYVDYFGGEERVASMDVPAVKTFGYGAPLFPLDGESIPCHCDPEAEDHHGPVTDLEAWLQEHWPNQFGPEIDGRPPEDLWETTRKVHALRSVEAIPADPQMWREEMAGALARQVIRLVNGLDAEGIHGDILTFLPSEKLIVEAVAAIRGDLAAEQVDVYPLLASMAVEEKEEALAVRPFGARRRVLVASNIAETSLTIDGIRFVIDSGLITQGVWDPVAASKSVPTKPHSQAGIRQRWGRVGRDAPGWVFPLYTRGQFDGLPVDTPPGSTRENLEQLMMTAKTGGIDDLEGFPWPAAHPYDPEKLDQTARQAMEDFAKERKRAVASLAVSGSVDVAGDATPLGKELQRFTTEGTPAFGLAVMFADQLACVPEVATAMVLLEGTQLAGTGGAKNPKLLRRDFEDPSEWRIQADSRHRALYTGCRDDLDFVIRVVAAWERADPDLPPWLPSERRRAWADQWWIDDRCLVAAAEKRRATLEALSPAMKEEVKRFLDVRLVPRTRAILSRVLATARYRRDERGNYRAADEEAPPADVHRGVRLSTPPEDVIALKRDSKDERLVIQNLVAVEDWALEPGADGGPPDAFELLARAAEHCAPRDLAVEDVDPLIPFLFSWPVGARVRCDLERVGEDRHEISTVAASIPPSAFPRDPVDPLAEVERADEEEKRWPGNHNPEPDEEALLEKQVLDPSDDEHDRERGLETNDYADTEGLVSTGTVIDALDPWRESDGDRPLPGVRLEEGEGNPCWDADGWYEVRGYEISDGGEVTVVLRAAWLPPEVREDPASHPDLLPGTEIEVCVGERVEGGGVSAREFWRLDGRGRFLLQSGRGARSRRPLDPPVGLDDDGADLLKQMKAGTVLPAEITLDREGTRSITFLPSLLRQLKDKRSGMVWLPLEGSGKKVPYWPAVAASPLGADPGGQGEAPRRAPRRGVAKLPARGADAGLSQSFGVPHRISGLKDTSFPLHAPVLVQLGLPGFAERASLDHHGRETCLEELVARFPRIVDFIEDRAGESVVRRFSYRDTLTPEVRDALLELDENRGWRQRVWIFYIGSHERRVRSVRPGEATKSIEVEAEQREESTPPFEIAGRLAQQWAPLFSPPGRFNAQREILAEECGARVRAEPPCDLELRWDDGADAPGGLRALERLLVQPTAVVTFPPEARGGIIGPGGVTIRGIGSREGVFGCALEEDAPELVLVARDDAALRSAIGAVSAAVGIRMTVPDPRSSGQLVGQKGVTVNRLREESGCTHAFAERGTPNWTLRAGELSSIEEFVRLADEIVPGCRLGGVVAGLTVRDAATGETVDDPAEHRFGSTAVPEVWRGAFERLRQAREAGPSRSEDPTPRRRRRRRKKSSDPDQDHDSSAASET